MSIYKKNVFVTGAFILLLIFNTFFFASTNSHQPVFADQTQDMLATDTTTGSVEDDDEDEWEVW